jgi:hypothetical protein
MSRTSALHLTCLPWIEQGDCRCATSEQEQWLRPRPHAADGKLGPGCTLDPAAFPACVAKWVSPVTPAAPHTQWTAVALFNMGENTTEAIVSLHELAIDPSRVWSLTDVWTGHAVGSLTGTQTLAFSLRPHASRFFKATSAK